MANANEAVQQHIRKEAINNFFINLLINGGLAFMLMRGAESLSLTGEDSYGADLLITAFLLSAILSSIFMIMHKKKRDKGEFSAMPAPGFIDWLPGNPWLSSLIIALLAIVLAVPPLLGAMSILNLTTLSPLAYAIVKGIWAGLLAAGLVVIAIRLGLRPAAEA